jgi:GAF domain-containing protein
VDVVIADSHHPHIRARIPAWYQQATEMRAFTLFPLKIRDVPVGLIYAAKEEAGSISFSESERGLLRTLRNQALLAIRQSL